MDALRYRLDYERSLTVACSGWARGKDCYRIAARALLRPGAFAAALYVEGWVVSLVPFEHSWLELGEWVIDPLLAQRTTSEFFYFPGVRYTRAQVLELRDAPLPFVDLRGKFGLTVAEYVAARDAAYAWFVRRNGMELRIPSQREGCRVSLL